MPVYTCKIGTSDGRILIQDHAAAAPAAARNTLESQGYFVFQVKRKSARLLSGILARRSAVSIRTLLHFNQELLVLINAGMPLLQVLDASIERHGTGALAEALRQVREDVKSGDALSTAMERHGHVFPNLYLASIRAGERTGDLPVTLQRYSIYLRKISAIRKKIVAALFYPCVLVTASVLATGLLLFYVIPVVSQVFADSGAQLPLLTRMLIAVAGALRGNVGILIALAVIGLVSFRLWTAGSAGRLTFDRCKVGVPYLGTVLREYSLAGFARTLASLLGSGMPIIEALRMASGTINNVFMEQRMRGAVTAVEEGGTLVGAFTRTGIMPPLMLRMLSVGESTGALEEMLNNCADHLEESLDERLHIITAAIEPAIMIGMGLVVGLIIIAMYLPIFQIAGTVG
jgi:type IV pilus assembly protein PilC